MIPGSIGDEQLGMRIPLPLRGRRKIDLHRTTPIENQYPWFFKRIRIPTLASEGRIPLAIMELNITVSYARSTVNQSANKTLTAVRNGMSFLTPDRPIRIWMGV